MPHGASRTATDKLGRPVSRASLSVTGEVRDECAVAVVFAVGVAGVRGASRGVPVHADVVFVGSRVRVHPVTRRAA